MNKYYLICLIVGLIFTIRFFIDLITNNIKGNKLVTFARGACSVGFTIVVLLIIRSKAVELLQIEELINEYSIIPLYLSFHIIICLFLCYIIFSVAFITYYIYLGIINIIKSILITIKATIISDDKRILDSSGKLFKLLKKYINPFYELRDYEISITRIMKMCFIISYLISGILMLSPITRYVKDEAKRELIKIEEKYQDNNSEFDDLEEIRKVNNLLESEDFTNDYELYKSVFVISLIPFSLNYMLKNK